MSETTQAKFGDERGLDCVRMKQDLQSHVFEATKDMTRAERTAYREQQAERFRRRLDNLAPAMAAETAARGSQAKRATGEGWKVLDRAPDVTPQAGDELPR